jgi:tRNA(Ser,Leu) C12 N-acetylase TAN1
MEIHAECELWFNLMTLGDESSIISKTGISGLLWAKSSVDPRTLIKSLKTKSHQDPHFVQFITKLYPIDLVCTSELDLIREFALSLVQSHPYTQDPASKYRITVRKRNTYLKTDEIIPLLADHISHPVSLKEFDWNLQIEIVANLTGISILKADEFFAPLQQSPPTSLALDLDDPLSF